jgi:hypothetical protein
MHARHTAPRIRPSHRSLRPALVATLALSFALVGLGACSEDPTEASGGDDAGAGRDVSRDRGRAVDDAEDSEDPAAGDDASAGEDTATGDFSVADTVDTPDFAGRPDGPVSICRDVDVLFVIDNSGSMADQQASLIASFPGFVEGMRENLAGALSLHVGVVTSDDYRQNRAGCTSIGDLITQTGGINSSNRVCTPFFRGGPFLTEAEPDLEDAFSCIARVGNTGNDDERMMRALLDAIDPANNAPGACNEGFVRPDALLIVVLISDEDDVRDGCDDSAFPPFCESEGSGGTPDDWFAELVDLRGSAEDVVVLSLIGRQADNACGAVVASRLLGFARRFGDNGFVGDVCAESYDEFFREAVPVIVRACQKE